MATADSVAATDKPVFRNLEADDAETTEIESLCVNCHENGVTKLLLTKIPHYKEVILMSFECEHCGFKNNEIQSGDRIQDRGRTIELTVKNTVDLNRQVVVSDYATVRVPELDLEIPAQKKQGQITTVEGILDRCVAGLSQEQPLRRALDPSAADQIDAFIDRLRAVQRFEKGPFTLLVDDPSGNSHVENPMMPKADPAMKTSQYVRDRSQNHLLGIFDEELQQVREEEDEDQAAHENEDLAGAALENEVLTFGTNCPSCNAPCETNMKVTNIPFFKECIIMATSCDACGERTNEVKSGSGIGEKGVRISLRLTDVADLSRDVLKSETCSFAIPELEFEVGAGTLGGKFTTLEGLLVAMKDQLFDHNPLLCGDSATAEAKERMAEFTAKLTDVIKGRRLGDIHLILDDPAGNSYLQNVYAPDDDPEMVVEHYERTFEHNEELGLNDMNVDNYRVDDPPAGSP